MRIDFRADPHHAAEVSRLYDLVDGELGLNLSQLEPVFMADDETGEWSAYIENAEGGYLIDPETGERMVEHRQGRILFVPKLP